MGPGTVDLAGPTEPLCSSLNSFTSKELFHLTSGQILPFVRVVRYLN